MSKQFLLIKELSEAIRRLEIGEKLFDSELARLVSEMTKMEVDEGGPYALSGDQPEVEFNALIAHFLFLCDVELPKLKDFLYTSDEKERGEAFKAWRNVVLKEKEEDVRHGPQYTAGEERVMDSIMKKFEERFAEFSSETRARARKAIVKTIHGNRDKQMSLMSFYTKQALGTNKETVSDNMVAEMGLANIFFWTAFIIFDDFWDVDEAADPKLLPIANTFARHYTDYFSHLLPAETEFRRFFHALMDKLDAANAWETEYCRARVENNIFYIPEALPDYKDYEQKYEPASGHILGPVAELVMRGSPLESPEIKNFILYFKHYLITMQLNDDAHDWEEDFRRGHISTVVDLMLRDLRETGWQKTTIDLEADLPELKKLFWFTTMPKYVKLVFANAEKARAALAAIKIFEDEKLLLRFIDRNENIARKAEQEQASTEAFLQMYRDL
ncbi:MAG: hypothetical protein A3I29_03575 [Candidatus Magasanikbacteria bacterium RIFCSPLOWO2_02_FULL_44_11]|uniref:Uncharacterized protein n=1 Tax=Candidatus Magasanikbacteria bacterium RIFCSPLOWO2_02_FULL_44_11 TaxID=1798689 RepID=A0A1F6NBL8_9BACT|nr:MAG: hypothetical protein A3I29_03575 [Candidatus Magasanikbacteria bacterium RIFCSPLOWO2_02_FULL_44_11]